MKKIIFIIIVVIILSGFATSCKNDDTQGEKEKVETTVKKAKDYQNNLNISILIDLSDRISPKKYPNSTMEYYERDLGYIQSISNSFVNHLKGKRIRQMNDKIQVFFNPEPQNPEINAISRSLKFQIDKNNVSEQLSQIGKMYSEEVSKIYDLAIQDDKYVGADIWRFFQNKLEDYCIDEKSRNILIVLTDGYMYHQDTKIIENGRTSYLTSKLVKSNQLNKPDWRQKIQENDLGFIKSNEDLSDIEVLVLGINPDSNNPYEEDVIKMYWSNWLKEMKVKHIEIKSTDLPSNTDKIIKDFITKNGVSEKMAL